MTRTRIANADWVVAWDAAAGSHQYLQNADVVFERESIVSVGPADGAHDPAERVIDGAGRMVMPGLVDIHTHLGHEPINKGYTDETGSVGLYNSNLYEYMVTMFGDAEVMPWQTRMAMAELLQSGVTTVVDMTLRYDGWIDVLAESGMRAVCAPMFRSAKWFTRNGHVVEYDWDVKRGEAEMAAALDLVAKAEAHPSGRLAGMVVPAQIDTCTPELMRDSHAEAARLGVRWQTHAAQSLPEFHEITRRTGRTPIQWLADLGVLDGNSLIGHSIFLDDHPWTRWGTSTDLGLLAESGATVAHCPTVFQRRGMALTWFDRYRKAGVNIGIGTDTFPHNMIEELRHALMVARLAMGSHRGATTAQVFDAATIGGAAALGRNDVGRLAPGAKADLVLVDVTHPLMQPCRDPIRSLVYAAADRAVRDVYVGGEKVVEDGRALNIDFARAAAEVHEGQRRSEAHVPERDLVAGRTGRQMSPPTYPIAGDNQTTQGARP